MKPLSLKLLVAAVASAALLGTAVPADARHDHRDWRHGYSDWRHVPPGHARHYKHPKKVVVKAPPRRPAVVHHHYHAPPPAYYRPAPVYYSRDPAIVIGVSIPPIVIPIR